MVSGFSGSGTSKMIDMGRACVAAVRVDHQSSDPLRGQTLQLDSLLHRSHPLNMIGLRPSNWSTLRHSGVRCRCEQEGNLGPTFICPRKTQLDHVQFSTSLRRARGETQTPEHGE